MFRMSVICVILLVLSVFCGRVEADHGVATPELPAALMAAGIGSSSVLDTQLAHSIRGEGGCRAPRVSYSKCGSTCSKPTPPTCDTTPCRPGKLTQHKAFAVEGIAEGTIVLAEGVIGEFQHIQETPNAVVATQGTFGGLAGVIGPTADGSLAFQMEGKALRETLFFSGAYLQTFGQVYTK